MLQAAACAERAGAAVFVELVAMHDDDCAVSLGAAHHLEMPAALSSLAAALVLRRHSLLRCIFVLMKKTRQESGFQALWYAVGGMEPGRARPMRGLPVKVSQSLS